MVKVFEKWLKEKKEQKPSMSASEITRENMIRLLNIEDEKTKILIIVNRGSVGVTGS